MHLQMLFFMWDYVLGYLVSHDSAACLDDFTKNKECIENNMLYSGFELNYIVCLKWMKTWSLLILTWSGSIK